MVAQAVSPARLDFLTATLVAAQNRTPNRTERAVSAPIHDASCLVSGVESDLRVEKLGDGAAGLGVVGRGFHFGAVAARNFEF